MIDRKASVLFVFFVLAVASVSASVGLYPGGSQFHLQGSNAEVNVSMEKSFSSVAVYSEALELGGRNFSVENYSSANLSVSLKAWNASAGSGEDVVRLNASAASGTFRLGLEGFAADTNFTVLRDGSVMEYVVSDSQGDLYFNYSGGAVRNFTVQVTNFAPSVSLTLGSSSVTQGSSVEIMCQASDSDGVSSTDLRVHGPDSSYGATCGQDFAETGTAGTYTVNFSATDSRGKSSWVVKSFEVTEEQTVSTGSGTEVLAIGGRFVKRWSSVYRDEFSVQHEAMGRSVEAVSFGTVRRAQSLELQVSEFSRAPDEVPRLTDVYRYASIEVKGLGNNRVSGGVLKFRVNSSFTERFDRVNGMRYSNGSWEKLPTTLVEERQGEDIYRVETPGFSYFAVIGENTQRRNDTQDSQTGNKTTEQDMEGNVTQSGTGLESTGDTAPPAGGRAEGLRQVVVILGSLAFLLLLVAAWRHLIHGGGEARDVVEEDDGEETSSSDVPDSKESETEEVEEEEGPEDEEGKP